MSDTSNGFNVVFVNNQLVLHENRSKPFWILIFVRRNELIWKGTQIYPIFELMRSYRMLCFFSCHETQFFEFSVHFYIRLGLTIFRDKWFLLVWRQYIWSICPWKSPYFVIYSPGDVTDFWECLKCWYQQFFQTFITSQKINIFSRGFFCSSRRTEEKSFR